MSTLTAIQNKLGIWAKKVCFYISDYAIIGYITKFLNQGGFTMNKPLFQISKKEIRKLRQLLKTSRNFRVTVRILSIILIAEGKTTKEVASILHISRKNVKRYIKIFAKGGIESLCKLDYHACGRKKYLTDDQLKQLEEYIDSHLCNTAKEIMDYIEKKFGIKYTESGVIKLLKELGYSYKKTRQIPSKADREKQEAFLKAYEKKKKEYQEKAKFFFLDAAHFLHNVINGCCWIKTGETRIIPTNTGRNRLNVLGAYSPEENRLIFIDNTSSCDSNMVMTLLKELRQNYPLDIRLIIILDNASYHHRKDVGTLAEELNIELFFLPPYSPNLNLIERLWRFIKKKLLRNKYYPVFKEFINAARKLLNNLSIYHDELSSLMTEKFEII